jgi:glycosyltransferase involved in cell wall biosynthesis
MPAPAEAPLVSVVMPAFDEEAYIAEAIESVFAQTYSALELIVVDDGSADRTAAVAARFPGVQVVRRRSRGGPAAARNAGLEVAHGAYWTIFDADDVMPRDRLALQVGFLEAHPSLGMVLGLTEAFVTAGDATPPHWNPAWDEGPFPAGASTTLARRRVFDLVGPYDERMKVSGDVDWLARAKDAGVVAGRVDEVCLHRRIHSGSVSANHDAVNVALLQVLRRSLQRRRAQSAAE